MTYKWNNKKKLAYVVFYGRIPGLYTTWPEVQKQINGFPDNHFLGFTSVEEAVEEWGDHVASLEEEKNDVGDDFLIDMDDLDNFYD
jgi:ribonuclease HI